MKKIFMALVGMVSLCAFDCFAAHDPVALHDRGNQKLIGNLEVVGKVTANEIAMPGGVSIGGTSSCQAGQTCVTDGALDKMNTIDALRDILGVGLADAKKIIENASEPKIVGGIYKEFTVDFGCTGNHNGAFGAGSVVVCGNDLANGGIVAPRIKTDELTAKSLSASNSLNAFNAIIENQLSSNSINVRTNIIANSAHFARAPLIPLVHYGLEVHAEHTDGFTGCTSEQAASFEADVRAVLEENLPGATLISVQCGSRVSFLSPTMLSDLESVPPVFRMFDSVSLYHPFQDYYESIGGSYSRMECGGESHGSIAVTVDGLGAALIVCRHEAERGIVSYRRYSSSAELIQF